MTLEAAQMARRCDHCQPERLVVEQLRRDRLDGRRGHAADRRQRFIQRVDPVVERLLAADP